MPLIEDLIKKKPRKFEKKEYRPWDLEASYVSEERLQPKGYEQLKEKSAPYTAVLKEVENNVSNLITEIATKNDPICEPLSVLETVETSLEDRSELNEEIIVPKTFVLDKFARGIYGLQKSILQLLIERTEFQDSDFAYTKPIFFSELSVTLRAPISSIKGTIHRLKECGIIDIYDYKPGRGGYTSYKIPKNIYSHFFGFFGIEQNT